MDWYIYKKKIVETWILSWVLSAHHWSSATSIKSLLPDLLHVRQDTHQMFRKIYTMNLVYNRNTKKKDKGSRT